MEYVEKAKWPTVEDSLHKYKSLDEALQYMERNKEMNILSSELFDENNKLIATFKKGKGVKVVEEIKEIAVKKETLDYLQNTGIARIMRDWHAWLDGTCITTNEVDEVFNNLNSAMYDSSASDIVEFYISGAYDFIPVEKTYRIILPEVKRSSSGDVWSYIYVGLTSSLKPIIEYTDNKEKIYTFPESKLKHFPKWAQVFAKEVE